MFEFSLNSTELMQRRLRYLIQTEYNGVSGFYQHLYEKKATESELERFNMFMKRGVGNWEFMDLLSQKTKVGEVALRRLFDVSVSNEALFND